MAGGQPKPLSDVITGSKDALTLARRKIIGLEKHARLLMGLPGQTGSAELLRQWEQWWDGSGQQPGDKRECSREVAQMLEGQAETLRMMAWERQTETQQSINPTMQHTQNQGAGIRTRPLDTGLEGVQCRVQAEN